MGRGQFYGLRRVICTGLQNTLKGFRGRTAVTDSKPREPQNVRSPGRRGGSCGAARSAGTATAARAGAAWRARRRGPRTPSAAPAPATRVARALPRDLQHTCSHRATRTMGTLLIFTWEVLSLRVHAPVFPAVVHMSMRLRRCHDRVAARALAPERPRARRGTPVLEDGPGPGGDGAPQPASVLGTASYCKSY